MEITKIRELCKSGKIKWKTHCLERMQERDIAIADVMSCIDSGEIIEDYPDDMPLPSCLVFGMTIQERVLHVVVSMNDDWVFFITAYYPDIIKFEKDLKTRRER